MTLTEMRRWLSARNIQLTRSLGQNFLHDGNQLRRIVAAAGLGAGDRVLEIGPGLGPLTERLLQEAGSLLAVEVDQRLVEVLRERFGGDERFELVHADALAWLRTTPRDWSDWVLVSNLPYSVGSPVLVELALAERPPRRMVVTLQEEVIDRLAAEPGTAEYGVLTLLVGLRFAVEGTFRVPRDCFFPAPDVESACAVLNRREADAGEAGWEPSYVTAVKTGFGQRRKMLLKVLSGVWAKEAVARAFEAMGLDPMIRAERVTREQFIALARQLVTAPRLAA